MRMRGPLAGFATAMVACGLDVVGRDAAVAEVPGSASAEAGAAEALDASADVATADVVVSVDGADGGPPPMRCREADGGPCPRVVFVSSTKLTGNLGGVQGADATCNALARASTHARVAGRRFQAWVGTNSTSPALRFDRRGSFIRPDDKVVAKSFEDLVDGSLVTAIEIDELGTKWTSADDDVWTGLTTAGATDATSCTGWTSAAADVTGGLGLLSEKNSDWTAARTDPCNDTNHLYCFEE